MHPVTKACALTATMLSLVLAVSAHAQPSQSSVTLRVSPPIQVSADSPDVPHVEPMLAAHPSDPRRLLGGAITAHDASTIDDLSRVRSDGFLSRDGGASWRRVALPGCRADPWVAFGPDGEAYVACHDQRQVGGRSLTGVLVHRSLDGGDNWLQPVQVPLGTGRSVDQPKMIVDHGPGEGRGSIFVTVGQWAALPTGDGFTFGTVVSRSTDRGQSFSDPVLIRHDRLDQQPIGIGMAPQGVLVVAFMDYAVNGAQPIRHRRTWTSRSTDGGLTFSLPSLVREQLQQELLWAVAVESSTGTTYAALDGHWVRENAPPPANNPPELAPLSLITSVDQGQRWSDPIRISDGPQLSNAETPTLAVNQDGVVAAAWYDTRHDPEGRCFDLYIAASVDGGQSFSDNIRVTPETSCPHEHAAQERFAQRWRFGGDYSGLAAAADGAFHVFWADSRTGPYQIWTARVEVSKSPS